MGKNEEAILKTILYSDIFNYPLTLEQVTHYLINNKSLQPYEVEKSVKKAADFVKEYNGYIFLKNKKKLLLTRERRIRESEKKLIIAENAAFFLSFLPSVYFIGISGGLSLKNVEENDDIDFFIITARDTIWITRFLLLLILEFLGLRRKKSSIVAKNKICLNMLVEETHMEIEQKDLYTAHEVIQVFPLAQYQNYYQKFLNSNKWITKYLPSSLKQNKNYTDNKNINFIRSWSVILLRSINPIAKKIQLILMTKQRTNEVIKDNYIAFHPLDFRSEVLAKYKKKLQQYNLYNTKYE